MKSGVAAMMAAMIGLKRSDASFNGEIIFQGVADEETGSQWGTVYLLDNGIGKNADFAIVSEPTSLKVATGNRGLRWIDISVKGSACHAGRPHLGINSVQYATNLIQAITSMKFESQNDFFEVPSPSISVTTIKGGTKVNIIPERCDLAIDRRMMPGETGDSVMKELQQVVDALLQDENELRVEMNVRSGFWDPFLTPENESVVQATLSAVEEVMGTRLEILGKAGCTDASHIFHRGAVPTAIFGPGNEKLAHKADECVEIEKLVASVSVFMSIFHKLLG
jgi:acetylornithine deacetylase/succinyl-diaminopimelate desuccinylase-like protein